MFYQLGFLLLFIFNSFVSASNPNPPKHYIDGISSYFKPPLNKALSDFLSIDENWDSLSLQNLFFQKLVECFTNRKEIKELSNTLNESKSSLVLGGLLYLFGVFIRPQSFTNSLSSLKSFLWMASSHKSSPDPILPLSEEDKKYLDQVDPLEVLKIAYQSFQICLYAKDVKTLFHNLDLLKSLQNIVPKSLYDGKSVADPHSSDIESSVDPHSNDKESGTDPLTDNGNYDTTKTSNTQRNPPPKGWSNTELALITGGIALVVIGIIIIVLKKKKSTTLPV
jgi:hypothetical protein